jgi:hypothetical protein
VPADHPHSIDSLRILAVNSLQSAMHAVGRGRDHDQMHVVWHQAVREDGQPFAARKRMQQPHIGLVITCGEENTLAMISSLRNVVGHTREYNTRTSWHLSTVLGGLPRRSRRSCVNDEI